MPEIPYEDDDATPIPAAPAAEPAAPAEPASKTSIPVVSALPVPSRGEMPSWVVWPDGLKAPRGRVVYFARFAANWTDTPDRGMEQGLSADEETTWKAYGVSIPEKWRQCIVWGLSIGDQKFALSRANGDSNRFNTELAKQMIRAVDGFVIDRSGVGGAGDLDQWWEQIGERCRSELTRLCVRVHSLSIQERTLFLSHCVAARTAG